MRLISLTVQNYRLHEKATVAFDRARTLLGGPNESGKSTLVEAMHRTLFLKAKVGGEVMKSMRSTVHAGHPEVTLSFEAKGKVWEVTKSFRGASGSAKLNVAGGQTWQGEEAESKLAELLSVEEAGRATAKTVDTQWPHLWVWQGHSGINPSGEAMEHRDALVQRLQSEGLAAVMQSDFDQRVRERIDAAYAELFTATGKSKAGSKPELTRMALEEAERRLNEAEEALQRLEEAVQQHQTAEVLLEESETILPKLLEQRRAAEAGLTKLKELRALATEQSRELQEAAARVKQLRQDEAQWEEGKHQVSAAEAELSPMMQRLAELDAQRGIAREALQREEQALRDAANDVRIARGRLDLSAALVAVFEKAELRGAAVKRAEEAAQVRDEIATVREAFAKLPALNAQELAKLRSLETEWQRTVAVREATAAEVRLVSVEPGVEVKVQGVALGEGEARTLLDETEILVGKNTRLQLRPGGGTSLAQARQQAEAAERALKEALTRWSVKDVQEAAQVVAQAEDLKQEGKRLQDKWKLLGAEKAQGDFEAAEAALQGAHAELERRKVGAGAAQGTEVTLPGSLQAARDWSVEARDFFEQQDRAERVGQGRHEVARKGAQDAEQAWLRESEVLNAKQQTLSALRGRVQMMEEKYPSPAARREVIVDAELAETQGRGKLEETNRRMVELQPELLQADWDRLGRSLAQQQENRRRAETDLAVARSQLALDGRSDPEAEVQQAQARATAAREQWALEDRRAQAVARLQQLFRQSREAIDRRLVEPLAQRVTGYLRCVFGPGAELKVALDKDGKLDFEISRADGSAFAFETLSGGAKEQVAAAVRLAMAEILAADHDGCLPLVFDDAFAYADPERVQQMQRMLDLAATRGLQVIVLTCNPADYSAFGASEVRLSRK